MAPALAVAVVALLPVGAGAADATAPASHPVTAGSADAASTTAATTPALPGPEGSQPRPALASGTVPAYWLVASDGGIFSFGGAGFYGSTGAMTLNKPIVGMAATHDSGGYWLVASDGGVFTFGDAGFYGSTGALTLNKPVVGMAATPDGLGYWLVATDGGIFAFGDAAFYGSTGAMTLNKPVVGMAATADGHGYWMVASDGGIFAFGDARFHGSTGAMTLNKPIVSMSPSPDGNGYMLVASDGGVFAYGDAPFWGSLGGEPLARPIVSMASTPTGDGYWFTDNNGGVSAFGSAAYWGSTPQVINKPVVGMVEAAGSGTFAAGPYQSGSYGYDVSNYQCNQTLPTGHAIGIVQVVGASFAHTNPCLSTEAQWAGAGLNLYMYLTYGTSGSGPALCNNDVACNFGFAAAQDAYTKALNTGVDTQVTWWLDVEPDPSWSTDLSENAQLVAGAMAGMRAEGINNVGIYASPGQWNNIVGSYQPPVPYWMADYNYSSGPATCTAVTNQRAKFLLPTGPVEVVQYGQSQYSNNTFDDDYAC